ncbi:bifunctional 4-hydroxy-2-oxoglutarate aldolase/2-dehydro-3-deoxy-phosphogluconate aldolase [Cryobacterium frigoriphilum]|uniref:2-dehydro-3-deoxy-phosphogluconate aldolase n=1 Tax=Cryobacterium frigoriphilum TaxID=1259150 RepID=A0A4R8ZV55_9MICO|nr:bifunctional 4-hydroxy-2-oxoglutarate aldolase/2-dehydro-3-deoxy-phosphogluconate aldolase [Cryobacterium frigoriphilum]TFD46916.1 bifunctional 4-hydroxy-2-oxoglutarate aldolase/2-dehydro-3-deoxy-phosphogluconate aldolase [Cryobacterium frigoriphilum]
MSLTPIYRNAVASGVAGPSGGTAEDGVLARLQRVGIVPVLVADDVSGAGDLADALVSGGLPVAEVTLRTAAGLDTIRRMAARGDMLVGAGTVLTADQVDQVVDAGASFVVSPGFSLEVVERCHRHGVSVVPGVATATEVQAAVAAGLSHVKFFPAGKLGGRPMIETFAEPFAGVRFMPSGGVSAANVADYLASPAIFAAGGSWMASKSLIAEKRFDDIARLSREASALVRGSAGAGSEVAR